MRTYKKPTIEEFITRANKIHNNKYNYDEVIYVNNKTKVKIQCKIHGYFYQNPNNHLNLKQGCPECGGTVKATKEQFIEKANKSHNNRYDYSEVIYVESFTKVKINCKIHGAFYQIPTNHITRKRGCPKCKGGVVLTQEEFLEKAKQIHKNRYNYDKVIYKNSISKVEIICSLHGSFKQTPNHHLGGGNCSKCSHIISQKQILWIESFHNSNIIMDYTVRINGKLYKPDGFDSTTNTIYEFNGDFWHGNPEIFKPEDINRSNKKSYGDLYKNTLRKEQALKAAGYNVISIWENDFDKLNNQEYQVTNPNST